MNMSSIEIFTLALQQTQATFRFWECSASGWASESVEMKLNEVQFGWLNDLTRTLELWCSKGESMTQGELILAYANLGALVEGWLKILLTVYHDDYSRDPITKNNRSSRVITIDSANAKFEELRTYCNKRLSLNNKWKVWIEKIQKRRNAIHAFSKRDIGTANDFVNDMVTFNNFIRMIDSYLPYPT